MCIQIRLHDCVAGTACLLSWQRYKLLSTKKRLLPEERLRAPAGLSRPVRVPECRWQRHLAPSICCSSVRHSAYGTSARTFACRTGRKGCLVDLPDNEILLGRDNYIKMLIIILVEASRLACLKYNSPHIFNDRPSPTVAIVEEHIGPIHVHSQPTRFYNMYKTCPSTDGKATGTCAIQKYYSCY